MNIEVLPLSQSSINWQPFLSNAKKALGINLTNKLDMAGIRTDTSAAFIIALAEMKGKNTSINDTLSNPGFLLEHLFYSFLVAAPRTAIHDIIESCPLSILFEQSISPDSYLAVISGDLSQWRSSIINGCSPLNTHSVRLFLDKCLMFFEKDGLGKLWSNYRKVRLMDKTFQLEQR